MAGAVPSIVNEPPGRSSLGQMLRRCAALAAPCVLLAWWVGRPWRWFSWHPLLMSLAFVPAAGSGILRKRLGGRANTLAHGYTMVVALALALCGWYVIYTHKITLGKPHYTSWHAWQGLLALAGYGAGAAGGLSGLHPDMGRCTASRPLRLVHKLSSRTATVAALVALGSGYAKLADPYTPPVVAVALLALAVALSLFERPTPIRRRIAASAGEAHSV